MLKPSAFKTAASAETTDMVASFLARGGIVTLQAPAVALGLRKTKYIRRIAKVVADPIVSE